MATRIQLEGYGDIDIAEGTQFPLNFNIQDLTKPDTTPANYSKNIKIVGSKSVNKILGHAYDVNITDGSFNVNKKVKCSIIQNGANIFEDAYFQLLGVEINGGAIIYNARVKSDLMSFFADIKNKELTDLTLFTPDDFQYLTKSNILATFNNTVADRWKYAINGNVTDNVFSVRDFRPAVYLKTYLDAIHAESGWEYEIKTPEKINFDKLIIPTSNKFDADDKAKEDNTFETDKPLGIVDINTGSPSSNGVTGQYNQRKWGTILNIQQGPDDKNPNGSFNYSNDIYTPQVYGEYKISIDAEYDLTYTFADAVRLQCIDTNRLDIRIVFEFTVENAAGVKRWPNTPAINVSHWENNTYPAGTSLIRSGNGRFETSLELYAGERITHFRIVLEEATDIAEMQSGWAARWISTTSSTTGISYNPKINLKKFNMKIVPDVNYDWGVPIILDDYVPKKIKQRDLIKSLIDGFKLIAYIDPNFENKIIYEIRDDYYDRGKEKDWSKKIDESKNINIEWLQDKQAKRKILTYKEDKDSLNKTYQDNVKEAYGTVIYEFENEYNIGEDKLELIFSPTPIVYNTAGNMYLSGLIIGDEDYNIRLLIDNGIKSGANYHIMDADNTVNYQETITTYPQMLHMDDAIRPAFDLNFYKSKYYYYNSWLDISFNSLFQFHKRSLNQLAEGRVMTAFFNLSELDIQQLELNDRIYIESTHSWWNINRVIDYNANGKQLTKVELVTIDDGQSINVSKRGSIKWGGIKEATSVGVLRPSTPNPSDPIVSDGIKGAVSLTSRITNKVSGGGGGFTTGVITGRGNRVTGNSLVVGNDNFVTGKNNVIIGSNNVDDGFSNKLIVGDNVTPIQGYPVSIQDVNIGGDINIKDIHYGEDGITKNGASLIIDDNDNIILDGDIEFNGTVNFSGATIPELDAKEDKSNKVQDLSNPDSTTYPSTDAVKNALDSKVESVTGTGVDNTDPSNPTISINKNTIGLGNVDNTQQIPLADKGANNGVAELDSSGKIPVSQLPSYVSDVETYPTLSSFPATGVDNIIYIAEDTNLTYRWTGTAYAEISPSIALGETSSTAYRGDRGKIAYDHSQLTSGNPHNVTKTDVGLSNVDNTSDINKPISTATQSALNGKVESVTGVAGVPVNNTDPRNPRIGLQDRLPILYTSGTQKLPSWYLANRPRSYTQEVKERSALGIDSLFTGDYWIGLTTTTLHGSFIDAPPIQVATSPSTGRMASRYALTTTTWSNWKEVGVGVEQNYLPIADRRSTNENPQWYFDNFPMKTTNEFKTISVMGLGSIFTLGTYCGVETINQWLDSTGGYPYQIATNPRDGKIAKRYGVSATTWSNWEEIGSGGGGGSMTITPITYSNLKTLKTSNSLTPGTRYFISDRDIWIDALDSNKLAMECKRHFRIVKDGYYTPHVVTLGNDIYYQGIYGQTIQRGSVPNSATFGDNYFAIWGGRMWQRNNSGLDVPGTSNETIAGGWTMINIVNNAYYESKIFDIKYNFDNDRIWEQSDDRGNKIKRTTNSTSYIDNTDWGNTNIYNNENFGIFNNFRNATIKATIFANSNNGAIYSNSNSIAIVNNSNNESIHNNSNNGGYIRNNSNTGSINNNSNTGDISNNSNLGYIADNSNIGGISNNSNNKYIRNNSNNGQIHNNSNNGQIEYNSNISGTTNIQFNTNTGFINRNIMNGSYLLEYNTNNGNIGVATGTITRNANITDTQANK